jgi:hypothetical protein
VTPLIIAWPLKRSILARLRSHADGVTPPPPGAELLATGDAEFDGAVQVEHALPAEPSRLCVYGAPLRLARSARTAEVGYGGGALVEAATVELRVRVYAPGEDIEGVDRMLGDLVQAVAVAVVSGNRFFDQGAIDLTAVVQDPTAVAGSPEPSVTAYASMTFLAEVIT